MAASILSSQGAAQAALSVKLGGGGNNSYPVSQELGEKITTIRPDPKRPGSSSSSCLGGLQVLGPSPSQVDGSGRGTSSTTWALLCSGSAERPSFLQFLDHICKASYPRRIFTSRETPACLLSCPFSKPEFICPFELKI